MNYIGFLNWAIVAVSIFNTIALLWLGLTVVLNAERPRWGTYVVGGGLLFGGLFFTAHTATVARDIQSITRELEVWWRLIWLPFIGGPYLWYLVMAWYSGALHVRNHRIWLLAVTALGLAALALSLVTSLLPPYQQFRGELSPPIFSIVGIPVVLLIYPVYSTLCIILSIAALRHPSASDRFMGDLARRRARPWLMAASGVLLLVSLTVGAVAAWVLVGISRDTIIIGDYDILVILHAYDLLVETLIAVAVVLMGKAIVSYEIFTGKTLPRSGLLRYWGNSLVLAAGYGALVSWSLDLPVDPIYRLMLATVLMTLFYALLSWRSYAERNRSMQRLRPFVTSQHLYEQMVAPLAPTQVDAAAPFRALCEDVLDARSAVLLPLGPLAPLVEPLFYDERVLNPDQIAPITIEPDLVARLSEAGVLCLPIVPAHYQGAIWSVPLWSERGLIGVFLLGPKRGDGLYTQEEIEVAQSAAERLIDTRASAELARRLMDIQRRRLAESQVLDRRTRRVLHDDVLPQIHTAMIMLQSIPVVPAIEKLPMLMAIPQQADSTAEIGADVVATLADAHRQIADLLHDLPTTSGADIARIGIVAALRVMVVREQPEAFENVVWEVDQAAEQAGQKLPPLVAEVLFYAAREAIRNAARHGRGSEPQRHLQLMIGATRTESGLALVIEDDGVGLGSGGPSSGSGRGLMLHSTMLAVVGGSLITERRTEGGTSVRLTVPS